MNRTATLLALVAAAALLLGGCGIEPAPARDTGGPAAPSPSAGAPPSAAASPPGAEQPVRLSYSGGQAGGDTGRVEVPLGSSVSLQVSGDTADEVHVHGYGRYFDVPAGGSATLTFTADIPGVFEVELHDQGLLLTQLQVTPK
ncbi:MAG: hypothetical protein GEU83_12860 [Pseudonocardiaceae bacterium]|nr:hypothetical protein [Pseudonocardiaceae bacterium]